MLYETAARAEEILGMDVPHLDLPSKPGRVISKGGTTNWVHWQTGTAVLLPRLLAGRAKARSSWLPASRATRSPLATCARSPGERGCLSYRRAAESFEFAARPLAHPGSSHEELEEVYGWTLHQLRHSLLAHEAEDGTSTPMLLARSRHASVRSLERYARPGPEAVARHVAAADPAARRRCP